MFWPIYLWNRYKERKEVERYLEQVAAAQRSKERIQALEKAREAYAKR